MRVAFLVFYFPVLSQTFVLNQITGLLDRGHEVDIYTNHLVSNSKVHPDVENYRLLERTYSPKIPSNRFWCVLKGLGLLLRYGYKNPLAVIRSLNFFKYGKPAASLTLLYMTVLMLRQKKNYDIIHCHFGQAGLQAAILREIGVLQGKVITTFHGNDITTYLKKEGNHAYHLLFELGDFFQPISNRWQRRLIELGCNSEIMVHRMGIDCGKFAFIPRKLRPDGQVKIVTIARLVEKKGVEYAIRAVAEIAKSKPNIIEYTIVGDGPLNKDLQQLIQKLEVSESVNILGWRQQEEVVEILHNSDILLAPSVTSKDGDQEGIPVALMEAMAMGMPIISTQHSGIPELVENGVSGFLVPERNVEILTEKLSYLVEHPEIWASMGAAGRRFVEEHYNIERLNDQLVRTYQRLLTSKNNNLQKVTCH